MKKSLLLLVLFCGLFNCTMPCFADNSKTTLDVVKLPKGAGPRTPEPSIYAYIEDGVLTVNIGRYLGYVSTTIEDSSNTEVDNDIEYINGTSTYVMNVSSLISGTYTVYFVFSDGREYYGTFTVE